ncbi:T-cell immunoglobulin and mucin domain-containing protein 4-like isoform X2 [Anguilla rostrata]|uniref:T-cell immunoglobulin and mucin domain-containing protein 4-like isoform X2 n=1 Tax=Anguilla rostrata TaxID=7938 RepID=UPI0030CEE488
MNALYSSILLNQMLFHLVPVCEGSMQTLIGKTGESVTLPCRYDIIANGPTHMCWGRGEVPWSKCSNTIVSTDGEKVTFSESDRYRLQSGVQEGDVSLTIINVTENDSGIYGCRVKIPGQFNDLKHNIYLNIVKGEGTTPPADTGNSDVPVQAQDISQTFNGNVIRIGAVIFIPGLIVIVILVLRSRQQKQRRSVVQYDHSAPTVQIRN